MWGKFSVKEKLPHLKTSLIAKNIAWKIIKIEIILCVLRYITVEYHSELYEPLLYIFSCFTIKKILSLGIFFSVPRDLTRSISVPDKLVKIFVYREAAWCVQSS